MAGSKVILILSASAGAGHMIAARALEHAFRTADPSAEVEVHDVLALTNRLFRHMYGGGYLALMRRAPVVLGWIYDAADRPESPLSGAIRRWVQDVNMRPVTRYITRRRPHLIVNTHFLPAEAVAHLRRRGDYECPQVTICTDFETHRIWVQPPTERYYTATELGRTYLETWQVPRERILVTGIPVRPGFDQSLPQDEARQRCGLDPQRPVVLLTAGAFGVGPTETLLRELLSLSQEVQIAVIVGRNEALHRRLDRLTNQGTPRAKIVGFTDKMHEWMRAADVLISKPGGLTASEALACALPQILINPVPGQETRNSDYLLEHGAAIRVNHPRLLGYRVAELLAANGPLPQMRTAAATIAHPQAAQTIVADALALLP
jgi:processive 1,2-diacylglycerol beta-glucosyltransferase